MNPGDTFFGLDQQGHLWIVLTSETPDGEVAVANLTTHDPDRRRICDDKCVIIRPGEHPYPSRDSCVFYRDAFLTSLEILGSGVRTRTYSRSDPLTPELLQRVRQGALDSMMTAGAVQSAVRRDLSQR